MPPISVMLKPSSSNCNLKCEYCFYHSLAQLRESFSYGMMSPDTLSVAIKKAMDFAHGERVYISFQGGEPLLSGKDFFIKAREYIDRFNVYGSEVLLGLQTNGTLIDDEWCDIFLQNKYLVGISLDGDKTINSYRIDNNGNETFSKALNSAELMLARGVDFNVLSVVTQKVADNIDKAYDFLTSRGFKYLQFIPCLKPFTGAEDGEMYMSGLKYGNFLINLFDRYYRDFMSGNYVSVRQMDNFVHLVAHRSIEQCGMNGHCNNQFIIEGDGSVFPCDFFCLDEYKLGNILNNDYLDMAHSDVSVKFIKESMVIADKCKKCNYFALCRGGCKRERLSLDFCSAYKMFFEKCLKGLQIIASIAFKK